MPPPSEKALIKKIGKDKVKIICSGPKDQLDIIKSKMDGNCHFSLIAMIFIVICNCDGNM